MKRLLHAAFILTLLIAFRSGAAGEQPLVAGVGPVGVTVSDLDRSIEFYTHVLHFKKLSEEENAGEDLEHVKGVFGLRIRVALLQLGDEQIELTQYLAPQGRPVPIDSRSNDGWFQHIAIIVRDMDAAYAWLRQNKIQFASSGPQTLPAWNKNAGGIRAFYFRDPDNHVLEVLWFPEGKGLPKWHQPGNDLFLGIDHTAIVVGNTEASLHFYRDLLGLMVVGTSENYGTEQEHLNNVAGARVRITSLRASHGPGIEFLEYVAPRDGRLIPADLHANDLAHWETTLITSFAASEWNGSLPNVERISSRPENVNVDGGLFTEFMVKDPNGHAVLLQSPAAANKNMSR
ncbi:MAG TPA: VOC family protein [Candidatus Angelobacter sp.]|jgi:catechol 2,3-dioxygenase-like lactoylglutathione lyase family enzyme